MKRPTRIAVEVLAPGFIGTVVLFAGYHDKFQATPSGITLPIFLGYLAFAYAFALIPSLVYAFLMETWLKRKATSDLGSLGVVTFSMVLGGLAGAAIRLASEAPVMWIGVFVGFVLGVIVSIGVVLEKRPNQALEPSR